MRGARQCVVKPINMQNIFGGSMQTILVANQKGGCGKSTIAVTLAAALANQGKRVALADADVQKSSLFWLKLRSSEAAPIVSVDWRDADDIGGLSKAASKADYLVIDAPGALAGDKAEQLIAECQAIFLPVLPAVFDLASSQKFIKNIQDIKRIRKGKVNVYAIANRVRASLFEYGEPSARLHELYAEFDIQPIAWLAERSIYPALAERGLSIFDQQQKPYRELQAQWQPLLAVLDDLADTPTKAAKTKHADQNIPPKSGSKKSANTWYE